MRCVLCRLCAFLGLAGLALVSFVLDAFADLPDDLADRVAWISSGVMRGRGSGCGVFTLHFLSLSSLS